MRILFIILLLSVSSLAQAQDEYQEFRQQKLALRDTIRVDSISINPVYFEVKLKSGALLDTTLYTIDYGHALWVKKPEAVIHADTLLFAYRVYPEFLTRAYFNYDKKLIVPSTGGIEKVIALREENTPQENNPFDGLNTSGSIVRGVTVGNNQNSTVNSELDLQISGKLSEQVSIRASIQDANIPQQEGAYSQRLDEFDQIFIELYSDTWNIRAGDINLVNDDSYFGHFTKKVQGLSLNGTRNQDHLQTDLFATGAIVRGVFTQSSFTGQEGNQGPYKLTGPNGELYVLIISGSERVYANGVLLKRGENEDYVINYNAGEIKFNPTFPITSEMRIAIEYQYSEQNYTRIIGYGGGKLRDKNDTFSLSAHVYTENDAKNQPLLQNLNTDRVAILQSAGDNYNAMIAPSASVDTYNENKILYRKATRDGKEIYIFSNNPDDELYAVRFSQVGANRGDYVISNGEAVTQIFEYLSPIDGIAQGSYAPVIQLTAPTKLQMAVVTGAYSPSPKTAINFEAAGSTKDLNLFSTLDDTDNDGFAGMLEIQQQIWQDTTSTQLEAHAKIDYIQKDFRNIERTYNIEFNRDWNIPITRIVNQNYVAGGLTFTNFEKGTATYNFEHLNFGSSYTGFRHNLNSHFSGKKLNTTLAASYLTTETDTTNSKFFRLYGSGIYDLNKKWIGTKIQAEDNTRHTGTNFALDNLSQRFKAIEGFVGIGDSTEVFVTVGYRNRSNDSLRLARLETVNHSNTYYLKSQLINSQKTKLSLYLNYRKLRYVDQAIPDESSFNSRLLFDKTFFDNFIKWNTVYETSSGTLPRQEYTFVKVDEGQGTHSWKDYNGDNIQQLQEFEIAQFNDEADFLKVLLPSRIFIKTHQNRFSQILVLNPQQWSGQQGWLKSLAHFYNQTSFLIDRQNLREGERFMLNPFQENEDELALNQTLRNTLFFNRGKQDFTTSYTYLTTVSKNLLSIGLQETKTQNHQLQFIHKINTNHLLNFETEIGKNASFSENYATRNFELKHYNLEPKISYLFGKNSRIAGYYAFGNEKNTLNGSEQLSRHNVGVDFAFSPSEKLSLNGEINYIQNLFEGSAFSPVAYQMLEGLQPGTNFTWNLIARRSITKFLDLNIAYFGRNSENTRTIHTGSVQLRAVF